VVWSEDGRLCHPNIIFGLHQRCLSPEKLRLGSQSILEKSICQVVNGDGEDSFASLPSGP